MIQDYNITLSFSEGEILLTQSVLTDKGMMHLPDLHGEDALEQLRKFRECEKLEDILPQLTQLEAF